MMSYLTWSKVTSYVTWLGLVPSETAGVHIYALGGRLD